MPPKTRKATEEQRRAQQRLCKKRKYIEIKNDPDLLAIEQEKRRNKYKKRKEEGKQKSINEQTPRAQREQRKKWRENSKRYRQKKNVNEKTPTFDPVLIEAAEENVDNIEKITHRDPLHQISPNINNVVRKVRYHELKKRCILMNRITKLKKKIDSQRKIIYRLNKKLQLQNKDATVTSVKPLSKLCIKSVHKSYVENVHNFYNDDANSTITAGKKEYVTKNKVKMQKRYLNAPLKTLYQIYLSQHRNIQISYSTFCKLRPFWVVFPKEVNRETCLCHRHVNMQLLLEGLHKACVISFKTCDQLIGKLCCDPRNLNCLKRNCICSSNNIAYKNVSEKNILLYEWRKTTKEMTLKNGTKKKMLITEKILKTVNMKDAINKLEEDLKPFFNHVHKIIFQYNAIKTLKQNITLNEAFIQVDFSENYALKFSEEIQSFHFGGSRQQVSLHTSVAYTHNFNTGSVNPISICTISDCLRHDAAAIWAHLIPLIQHVVEVNPFIETLHFLSDSPSSQYRNKCMFFIVSQISQDFPQITKLTWNYSEAGHGKGAPDGVGAVLKRTADRMTLFGQDIGTFDQFYEKMLTVENIVIKKVDEQDIQNKEKLIPKTLKPFRGTLNVYQVLWDKSSPKTVMRNLSCFDCVHGYKECIHGHDIGYVNCVTPLSKPVHQNQVHFSQNPNKRVTVLSDITLRQSNTFDTSIYGDSKPSTSKM